MHLRSPSKQPPILQRLPAQLAISYIYVISSSLFPLFKAFKFQYIPSVLLLTVNKPRYHNLICGAQTVFFVCVILLLSTLNFTHNFTAQSFSLTKSSCNYSCPFCLKQPTAVNAVTSLLTPFTKSLYAEIRTYMIYFPNIQIVI